jgi:pyrrolysine biosynthesis protein PylC
MDRDYDCKRVLAPSLLPSDLTGLFEEMAVTLAEAVGLSGIMDVEAIYHEGRLEVLEIDARFPSQTPIAVYHSTGINMVEGLARIFTPRDERKPDPVPDPAHPAPDPAPALAVRGAVLEHIRVHDGQLSVCGEHVMAEGGPLHLEAGFFGADEALTNHAAGRNDWVATLMVEGSNPEDARERRDRVIREIRNRFGLKIYSDEYPQERFSRV